MVTVGAVNQTASIPHLEDLLSRSRERIYAAAVHFPGMRSMPFRDTVHALMENQVQLEGRLSSIGRQPQNLGLWPAIVIAGGSLLTVLGAWVYKQDRETKEITTRMELYDRLILEGHTTDEASRMAFGDGGGIGDVLNKLIILGAIGAGLLVYLKMK